MSLGLLLFYEEKLGGFGVVLYGEFVCIYLLYWFLNNMFWGDVPCAWIWRVVRARLFETGNFDPFIWLNRP